MIAYANVITTIKNFVDSSRANYIYIALSLKKIILPNLLITINFFKYRKILCFLYQG